MRSATPDPAAPLTMTVPLLLTAVVALGGIEALLVWRFGWSVTFVAYGYFGAIAVGLGPHDLATLRVPDAIVLPSYPIAIGLLALASGVGHEWDALARGSVAMVGVGLVFLALAFVMVGRLGLADERLFGASGETPRRQPARRASRSKEPRFVPPVTIRP